MMRSASVGQREVGGFRARRCPRRGGNRGPRFGGERAVAARRQAAADQRRFDGDRARAAERIDERPLGRQKLSCTIAAASVSRSCASAASVR